MAESQAFHGLEAYSGRNKPIHTLISQARGINSVRGEICTANRLIGKIGVVVDAIHTVAINGDVFSGVRADGTRTFSPAENQGKSWFVDGPIEEKWDHRESDWTNQEGLSNECLRRAGKSATANGRKYAEYFARTPSVRCVVFAKAAGKLVEKKARVIARALGTVAMPVDATTPLELYQVD